jgi:hypothetical protein
MVLPGVSRRRSYPTPGAYSKEQAERIQDIRRSLLAKNGTGRLAFKAAEDSADRKEGAFPQPTENAVS